MYKILSTVVFFSCLIYSQSTRNLVNQGVEKYENQNYSEAEADFRKGTGNEPESFEANFNLGDAYYKQEKYDEAVNSFNQSLRLAESKNEKAKVYHNIGNSLLKSNKVKESIEAYKNSLKLNPDDQDTKYNLSYALALLNQQQQQKQQDKNNQDKNQQNDQKQNQKDQQQNDQKRDQKDQQQNDQQQQPRTPEDQKTQQDQLKQPERNEMTKEEAEQILNALKNNEEDLQKKLRKKTGVRVKTEKDW